MLTSESGQGLGHLVRYDEEVPQIGDAEGGEEGNVCSVPSGGHENAAYARHVVIIACVERPPAAAEVDLEPGTEIHGGRRQVYANIAQVARGVAGRDIQAAAKGDSEMLVVAAHTHAFRVNIQGRL